MSKAAKRERQRINREARREAEQQWLKRRRALRLARNIAIPILIVIAAAVIINLVRDGGSDDAADDATDTTEAAATDLPDGCELDEPPPMELDEGAELVATLETSEGPFEIALDGAQAPQTVNAFVYHARNGCYDGLTFHRVVENFVIQGGDPTGQGTGGFGYTLPDEPPAEGYAVGTVAMANSGRGTTGSQFFVVLTDDAAESLHANGVAQAAQDGGSELLYSLLGQVTAGMDVVEAIGLLDPATTTIVIESITVTADGDPLGPAAETDDDGDDGDDGDDDTE